MGNKTKAVVNADRPQLLEIERLVSAGKYKSVSAFMREAVDEKLDRLQSSRLSEQVAHYVAAGHADEDNDLIAMQAFPGVRRKRRAKR